MHIYKHIAFIIFIVGFSILKSVAQVYPVQVNAVIIPPYHTQLSSYAAGTDNKLNVQLLMTDLNEVNHQVRLKLYIEGNGLSIQSRDFIIGAQPLFVSGGFQTTLTSTDLKPYFEFQNLLGVSPKQYSKQLPEGMYKFCFEVYDAITNKKISRKSCTLVYLLLNDPPILNIPRKAEQVPIQTPTNIVFQWTPRHVNAINVSYDFELREIWDANVDPQAAFLASPNYYSETTHSTSLLYNISKTTLTAGKTYAWRVRAKSTTGLSENAIFKNNGYSEIYHFTYKSNCKAPLFPFSKAYSATKVRIYWESNPAHHKYHLQYKRAGVSDAKWFEIFTHNDQAYIDNLEPGETYIFRIGGTCNPITSLNPTYTYSNISRFTMPKNNQQGYNCGVIPKIEVSDAKLLKTIGIGETFTAGDFPVTITEISGSNGNFSGKGFIRVPYLMFAKIEMAFENIKINSDYQLAEGAVVTEYDPGWGNVAGIRAGIDEITTQINQLGTLLETLKNIAEEQYAEGELTETEFDKITKEIENLNQTKEDVEQIIKTTEGFYEESKSTENKEEKNELLDKAKESLEQGKVNQKEIESATTSIAQNLGYDPNSSVPIVVGTDPYFDGTVPIGLTGEATPIQLDQGINYDVEMLSDPSYAENNPIFSTKNNNTYFFITHTKTPQATIDSLKQLMETPESNHIFWNHYDLDNDQIKYKTSFGSQVENLLGVTLKEYVKLFNININYKAKALNKFIGSTLAEATLGLPLLIEELKNHPLLQDDLINNYTSFEITKVVLEFIEQCSGEYQNQKGGIYPKCLWNHDRIIIMAYQAGVIDGAWETLAGMVDMVKFIEAWNPMSSYFYSSAGKNTRAQTLQLMIMIHQLDKEDTLTSTLQNTFKKELTDYYDETTALTPQARYNQGKLIFDVASMFFGVGEVKAFIKTGAITSTTFSALKKVAKGAKILIKKLPGKLKIAQNNIITYAVNAKLNINIARFDGSTMIIQKWIDKPIEIVQHIGKTSFKKTDNAVEEIAEIGIVKDANGKYGVGVVNGLAKLIRGVSKNNFITKTKSLIQIDKLNEAFKLWENQNWSKLENYFKTHGLGNVKWPPCDGFINIQKKVLKKDEILDRFDWNGSNTPDGNRHGKFASPKKLNGEKYSFEERALSGNVNDYSEFYELKILKDLEVEIGDIIPWFGKSGKGKQVKFSKDIDDLIEEGFIEIINIQNQ